ncbi:MAG TPA: sulfatase-like hydrolase/transferase, partial [Catalimonadaceae bacterium]|nr:sulfatase-like hydrolase/transferase [Catalimonadaceae bacterium]
MKKIILSAVFLISLLEVFAQRTVALLIADDLGTDYFGFYEDHGDTVAVPNIRSLLRNGVRFQNAMSNPVCSATRSGMLTGRYGFRTGVGSIVGSTAGSGQISTTE